MTTYLQLVQTLANESGTIAGAGPVGAASALPTAVASATGQLLKMTSWITKAYTDIQIARSDWLWLRAEFSATITSSAAEYAGSDFSLTRFSRWRYNPTGDSGITCYLTATGRSDEQPLSFAPWDVFRRLYLRGANFSLQNRPSVFSVTPANKLYFWPKPDDTYTVLGEYKKSPQVLAADADVPEMPAEFHDLIWMRAWKTSEIYDESYGRFSFLIQEERRLWTALLVHQVPAPSIEYPLA